MAIPKVHRVREGGKRSSEFQATNQQSFVAMKANMNTDPGPIQAVIGWKML